jgi:hypothetical protein
MSGGSFDYLCYKRIDNIGEARGNLARMSEALVQYEGGSAAAAATREILLDLERIGQKIKRLSDVWHAVEWDRSGDWGPDDVVKELSQYNAVLPNAVASDVPERVADAALASMPGGAAAWPMLRMIVVAAVRSALDGAR